MTVAILAAPPLARLPIGLAYYPGARCPDCGGRKFHVGRVTAECTWCDAPLVILDQRPLATLSGD